MKPEHSIRVAVCGLGPVGREMTEVIRSRSWAELVAVVDIDPELEGEMVAGIPVTPALTVPCDIVAHATVSALDRAVPQIASLVDRGCNVISTCEELSFPLDAELEHRIDEAAAQKGVTVLGAGINPGFLLDALPVRLATCCQTIESVVARRIVDVGARREPLQRKVGAGLSLDEWRKRCAEGQIRHVGLPESARLLAAGLGWTNIEFSEEAIEPVVAERNLKTEVLDIPAGSAAGIRQTVVGTRGEQEVLRLELEMSVAVDDPRDEVVIEGLPPVRMRIPGGVHGDRATSAVITNLIPRVVEAAPGLTTVLDIPLGYG